MLKHSPSDTRSASVEESLVLPAHTPSHKNQLQTIEWHMKQKEKKKLQV